MSISLDQSASFGMCFNTDLLKQQVRWIRDDLDPLVSRDGPDVLHPDDVLTIHGMVEELQENPLPIEIIRETRIHHALLEIAGRATRWPHKLIDKVDELVEEWQAKFGPLHKIGIALYEPGGRLHGISTLEDTDKDKLLVKWMRSKNARVSPMVARRHGELSFKPGDWWINPLYAYRDGIIDRWDPKGGIVADGQGAYAVLMTDNDEVSSISADRFTYRSKEDDGGRYKLTAADVKSRHPVRILRSHTLRSLYAPRAGVRYDGLFRVSGFTVTYDESIRKHNYNIRFERLKGQLPMTDVLNRPRADEIEDYREYKRLRQMALMIGPSHLVRATPIGKLWSFDGAVDGEASDDFEEPFDKMERRRTSLIGASLDENVVLFGDVEVAEKRDSGLGAMVGDGCGLPV